MSLLSSSLDRSLLFLKKRLTRISSWGQEFERKFCSKPGGKSGLFLSGVRGLSQGDGFDLLKVLQKMSNVGPIRGWALIFFERFLGRNYGRDLICWENCFCSKDTQSFTEWWMFQSTIRARRAAWWYFFRSGNAIPPLFLGKLSLLNLILEYLLLHIKMEHALRKDSKKDVGSLMGIVCITYRKRGRILIFIREALPNQDTFKEFHLFKSSCVSFRIGVKLSLKRSFRFVGISI